MNLFRIYLGDPSSFLRGAWATHPHSFGGTHQFFGGAWTFVHFETHVYTYIVFIAQQVSAFFVAFVHAIKDACLVIFAGALL